MRIDRFLTALLACLALIIIASIVIFVPHPPLMPQKSPTSPQTRQNGQPGPQSGLGESTVWIADKNFTVLTASTAAEQEEGLSGRTSLPPEEGMLFVFKEEGNWGFWMKDMNFPLDIIWLDQGGRVVTVRSSLSPSTYPQVFYPTAPARFVLEFNAGFAAAHHIMPGGQIGIPSGL